MFLFTVRIDEGDEVAAQCRGQMVGAASQYRAQVDVLHWVHHLDDDDVLVVVIDVETNGERGRVSQLEVDAIHMGVH